MSELQSSTSDAESKKRGGKRSSKTPVKRLLPAAIKPKGTNTAAASKRSIPPPAMML